MTPRVAPTASGRGRALHRGQRAGFPAGDPEPTRPGQDLPVHQLGAHGGGLSGRREHSPGDCAFRIFLTCSFHLSHAALHGSEMLVLQKTMRLCIQGMRKV